MALVYLADIKLKRNETEKAKELLNRALQLKADIPLAYIDLGAILAEQKQYQQAFAALQRAVALDPDQPDAHFRLARVYKAVGNTAESQKEFAKVRELQKKADQTLASRMPTAAPPLQK